MSALATGRTDDPIAARYACLVASAHRDGLTFSVHTILPLVGYLQDCNLDPAPLLARAGLTGDELEEPDARISRRAQHLLWEAAFDEMGDPALGLRVAASIRASAFGLLGYLATASADGHDAFGRVRRLMRLMAEGVDATLERSHEFVSLRHHVSDDVPLPRWSADYTIGTMVRMASLLHQDAALVHEMWFVHAAPSYEPLYRSLLGVPARFDADYKSTRTARGTPVRRIAPARARHSGGSR